MNDSEFRLLHSQYCDKQTSLTIDQLFSLIDYLHKENIDLENKLEESYNDNDRDREPFSNKEDLD